MRDARRARERSPCTKRTSSAATSSRVGSARVSVDDLAQSPRVPLRAATDHHRVGSRRREHRLCAGARRHVARGDDGNVDERDELGGERVISGARVHLLRGAGVERQRGRARLDEPRAELESRPGAVLDAAPQLHRHRHADRACDGGDDPAREILILEEVRTRARLRDLLHRAAEVDVHDVGSDGLDHPRSVRHRSGIRSEELDRERMLVRGHAEVAEGLLVAVLDAGAADHLGADEPGAVAAALAPKRLHADARHRSEHEPRGHLDGADPPGFAKVDHG